MDETRTCTHCHQTRPSNEFISFEDGSTTKWCARCRNWARDYTRRRGRTRREKLRRKSQLRIWKRTFPGWCYTRWHHMRLRCGYLGTDAMRDRHRQFDAYQHVTLDVTKDEFYSWAQSQRDAWEALVAEGKKPSVDRIDPSKGYALGNIRIVDLRANIAAGASNCAKLHNPKRRKSA